MGHKKDAAENVDAVNNIHSDTKLAMNGNYSEREISEEDSKAVDHSMTNSQQKISLDATYESDSDTERTEDNSEEPTDAVLVPSQKQLSNTQSIKTTVTVTEATKPKEKDK